MTLHRWRKLSASGDLAESLDPPEIGMAEGDQNDRTYKEDVRQIDELKLENGRLRRIVSDLMLEKVKIQEALEKLKK